MAVSQKMNGRAMSLPGGVLIGSLSALGWTVVVSVILAKLIEMGTLHENAVGYGSMIILLTASMLGSRIAWGKVKRQRAAVCFSTGGIYLLMLMATTVLFFGGQYEAVGVTTFLVGAGCSVTLLMSLREKNSGSRNVRKIRR